MPIPGTEVDVSEARATMNVTLVRGGGKWEQQLCRKAVLHLAPLAQDVALHNHSWDTTLLRVNIETPIFDNLFGHR